MNVAERTHIKTLNETISSSASIHLSARKASLRENKGGRSREAETLSTEETELMREGGQKEDINRMAIYLSELRQCLYL